MIGFGLIGRIHTRSFHCGSLMFSLVALAETYQPSASKPGPP